MPVFSAEQLEHVSTSLFKKMGVPHNVAKVVSNHIVENCLYGHDSHGMALVPRFIKDIESGKIRPKAKTKVLKKNNCTAWINGNRGFGQVTMTDAMNTAIAMAKKAGVSAVTVTNCNHVGILWTFAKTAAEHGVISIIWCAAGPQGGLVAPYGGKRRAIGANPMAIGIPAGEMRPFVLDISTSAAAGGKIALYAQQGKQIPDNWLLDVNGDPTTNPNDLYRNGVLAGALLPMAGYKGFGLGLVGEILGGILTGYGPAYTPNYKEGNGVFITVIDVANFFPLDDFCKQADALFRHVKKTPTESGTKEILIPGELEYRTREQREHKGIPVTKAVWTDINALASKFKVNLK